MIRITANGSDSDKVNVKIEAKDVTFDELQSFEDAVRQLKDYLLHGFVGEEDE